MDYNSGPYNVTFPVGSTNVSFDIVINNDDNLLEDDETFNISIISITNGLIVGTPGVATVTIIDTTGQYCITSIRLYLAHAGRDINLIYPCPRYLCPSLSGTKKHKCEKYNITLFFNRLHGVLH